MTMQRVNVQSSNLDAIGYDRDEQKLEVTFVNGSVYEYENVPEEVVSEMLAANSHGSYFSQNIRNVFNFTRIS